MNKTIVPVVSIAGVVVMGVFISVLHTPPVFAHENGGGGEAPTLSVLPETDSLSVGDPLLVRVTLSAPHRLEIKKQFSAGTGVVSFALAPPDGAFRATRIRGQGLDCVYGAKTVVPAGGSLTSYEWLFLERGRFVFSIAGTWRLRASVVVGNRTLVSDPVDLEIVAQNPVPPRAVMAARGSFDDAIEEFASCSPERIKTVRFLSHAAGDSNTKAVCERILRLNDGKVAGSKVFVESICEYGRTLSGPAAEHFKLEAAAAFISVGRHAAAAAILREVPAQNSRKDQLRLIAGHLDG